MIWTETCWRQVLDDKKRGLSSNHVWTQFLAHQRSYSRSNCFAIVRQTFFHHIFTKRYGSEIASNEPFQSIIVSWDCTCAFASNFCDMLLLIQDLDFLSNVPRRKTKNMTRFVRNYICGLFNKALKSLLISVLIKEPPWNNICISAGGIVCTATGPWLLVHYFQW